MFFNKIFHIFLFSPVVQYTFVSHHNQKRIQRWELEIEIERARIHCVPWGLEIQRVVGREDLSNFGMVSLYVKVWVPRLTVF